MIGDLLAIELGQSRFTWGQINLADPSAARREYIAALTAADAGDYAPLLAFARS